MDASRETVPTLLRHLCSSDRSIVREQLAPHPPHEGGRRICHQVFALQKKVMHSGTL